MSAAAAIIAPIKLMMKINNPTPHNVRLGSSGAIFFRFAFPCNRIDIAPHTQLQCNMRCNKTATAKDARIANRKRLQASKDIDHSSHSPACDLAGKTNSRITEQVHSAINNSSKIASTNRLTSVRDTFRVIAASSIDCKKCSASHRLIFQRH